MINRFTIIRVRTTDNIKMYWITILLFAVLWIIFKRWQNRRLYRLSRKLKTDFKKYPFIGHAHLLIGNEEERMKAIELIGRDSIKHGGMSNFWLGENYNILLSDADAIKFVLKECLEKNGIVQISRTLIDNGSVIAPVPIWRPRRKILAPTFRLMCLKQFMCVFAKQSKILAESLQEVSGTGSFSIWKYITAYTMHVICETTFGVRLNVQKDAYAQFPKAIDECLRLLLQRMIKPWLNSNFIYKLLPMNTELLKNKRVITNFINDAIVSKRESMKKEQNAIELTQDDEQNEIKTSLDMLIELSASAHGYADSEIREETTMLIIAGVDTSALTISFTALMLARHMDVQQKVYQELQEVFGDSDRDVVFEDLLSLKYLEAVVKETLRLYPPIPIIGRKIEKDIQLPSGLTLVKGCEVGVHIWAVHRNPRYWGDDAEIFNPERFMKPLMNPNAFVPFSSGPRNCIGYKYALMKIKTGLAVLLRKYRILLPDDRNGTNPSKDEPLRLKYDIVTSDINKFTLRLETRNQHH